MTFLGDISMPVYMLHGVIAKGFALFINDTPTVDLWDLTSDTPSDDIMDAYKDEYLTMPPWGGLVVLPLALFLGWVVVRSRSREFDQKPPGLQGDVVGNPVS